jgi:hypothetical protein
MRVAGGRAGRVWDPATGRAEMFDAHEAIGFLRFVSHQEVAAEVTIVEAAPCGQFDLSFCSIACLRALITARIDELENVAGRARSRRGRKAKSSQ